jgi:hypothetical protein
MKTKFIAKYDFDGRKCMELRQQWWEQGKKRKIDFFILPRYKDAGVWLLKTTQQDL